MLNTVRKWFFRQKYRYDIGSSWMSIVNFMLLLLATSEKIGGKLHIKDTTLMVLIIFPAVICLIWLLGWFMDVVVKQQQQQERESIERSVVHHEFMGLLYDIQAKVDKLIEGRPTHE